MNFTFPTKKHHDPTYKNISESKKIDLDDGISIIGNVKDLPFNKLILKIVNTISSIETAKRIIIINPTQSLLNTTMKTHSKSQKIVIVTKKSALTGSSDIPIFAVKSDSIPGQAGFKIIHNVNVVTGKIPVTLLYTFLFDIEKNIHELTRYRLGYFFSIEHINTMIRMKPTYTSSTPLHELVEKNYYKTIESSFLHY